VLRAELKEAIVTSTIGRAEERPGRSVLAGSRQGVVRPLTVRSAGLPSITAATPFTAVRDKNRQKRKIVLAGSGGGEGKRDSI
jgi:hypothetical protein